MNVLEGEFLRDHGSRANIMQRDPEENDMLNPYGRTLVGKISLDIRRAHRASHSRRTTQARQNHVSRTSGWAAMDHVCCGDADIL